eukprot:1149671-Pelagomonas_calceolata.AAC.2
MGGKAGWGGAGGWGFDQATQGSTGISAKLATGGETLMAWDGLGDYAPGGLCPQKPCWEIAKPQNAAAFYFSSYRNATRLMLTYFACHASLLLRVGSPPAMQPACPRRSAHHPHCRTEPGGS